MVGHPKHVAKALAQGVDLICAQAGEGGGHTGDIPASILIPACVDAVKGHKSPLTGKPVYVVGAGAVYDGRGLAANLSWGAEAVCAYLVIYIQAAAESVCYRGWNPLCCLNRSRCSQDPQGLGCQRRLRGCRDDSHFHWPTSPCTQDPLRC